MATRDSNETSPSGAPLRAPDPESGAATRPGTGAASAAIIRRAVAGDARAIAEVGVKGWQAAYRGLLPDDFLAGLSVAARETAWRTMLEADADGDAPSWVAELDGEVVAFLSSGPPRDEDVRRPAAEFYAIYVLPSAWRRGLGRALMKTSIDHWRAVHVTVLVLWVLEQNGQGRAFYESVGWRPDGGRQAISLGGVTTIEIRYRYHQPD
jgi:GNAT superfamily N-acetyltransferase